MRIASLVDQQDGSTAGFVRLGNVLAVGVLAIFLARLYGLVFGPVFNGAGIEPDPSAFQLLASSGLAYSSAQAGLIVLAAAALVVRFNPPHDGLRSTLYFSSVIIFVGSVAPLVSLVFSDTRVSIYDSDQLTTALLFGPGIAAAQAVAAVMTLRYEREANRVPNIAVIGLLFSVAIRLPSGYSQNRGLSTEGAGGLATYLSGVANFDWIALMAAALLVSLTGWVQNLRKLVITVSLLSFLLALAYLVAATAIEPGDPQFHSATATFSAPSVLLASMMAAGLALWPFVTSAPATEPSDYGESDFSAAEDDEIDDFADIRDTAGIYDLDD